jgi:hypothetical protein
MKKFLLILLMTSLTGCASLTINSHPTPPVPPPPPTPIVVISSTPPITAPAIDPIILAPVTWTVYNSAELKNLSDKLAASGANVVLFTLDQTNFKNLSDNLSSIDSLVKQQNASINFLLKAANAPANAATPPPTGKK